MTQGYDAVAELAIDLNASIPVGPGAERVVLDDVVVWLGAGTHPLLNVALRVRLGVDVAVRVEAVREVFRARGRREATWEIAPTSTPHDIIETLRGLGMRPYEEPHATAMVLRRPLATGVSEVVTRRVDDIEDAIRASEVLNAVFQERSETAAERRARITKDWERDRSEGRAVYLASIDDKVVAAAHAWLLRDAVVLCGGATLPEARGRGAYRALVAARYEDAVSRGTPVLVVQASDMSRPILTELGFETVATITVMHDRF